MGAAFPLVSLLIICAAAGFLVRELLLLRRGIQSQSWPYTEGTILSSRVKQAGQYDSTQYRVAVRYQYVVDGTTYTSRRRAFGLRYSTGRHDARKVADEYSAGTTVTVYYDPKNPKLAALEPGIAVENFIVLAVCLVFLVIGLRLLLARL
jgi:hypothetical protein